MEQAAIGLTLLWLMWKWCNKMIVDLVRVFKCDHQYCLAKARVKTSSMAYGTNDRMERNGLEKRGWVVWGLKEFCKEHKGDAK